MSEKNVVLRPLGDRVIVQRLKELDTSKGGIIIPDQAKEKPIEGEVIAVGRGRRDDGGRYVEPEVKAGDRILFGKYAGQDVEVDGAKHLILREEDILCTVERKT